MHKENSYYYTYPGSGSRWYIGKWETKPKIIESFRCNECGTTMPTEGLILYHSTNAHNPPSKFEKRVVNLELIV